ncbi:MAG: BtpA/SgcQ family protein [Candidatus Paceibacterota bacterium]|jgi:hypothetical protein
MNKMLFKKIFKKEKPIIAMIHVFKQEENRQIAQALEDLKKLEPYVEGVIVENYGWGYLDANTATEETAKALLKITEAVMKKAKIPVGINVLPNDYEKAFRIAGLTGANFVQLDHVTGEFVGCRSVNQRDLLAVRKHYPKIALLGGIHPKYYELVDPNTPISESAMKAMALTDAIVVTGEYTGGETRLEDLRIVKQAVGKHPVIIGSGLTSTNASSQLLIANGAIAGTAFKKKGVCPNEPIDQDMVKNLMNEIYKLR